MDNFEKVEKLRERANVSYEEAKQALENSNWDILDAMIYLEKRGRTQDGETAQFTTKSQGSAEQEKTFQEDKVSFADVLKRFGKWCVKWINKGNRNSFCVEQRGKEIFRVPITLLVALLFFAFWVVVPLMIVGLFFDMRYHFAGPDIHSVDINQAMDKMADAAENIKSDIIDVDAKDVD